LTHASHESSGWRYIFKNASIIATLSGLGVISGLILDALILSTYGVGSETDALFTALTVPLLITTIFSIQSPKILIPVFSEHLRHNDCDTAWSLLRNLLTTAFCSLVAICLLGMALSAIIVPLQIPGFESKTVATAVELSRILFWVILSGGIASILGSVLYAQHRYVASASGKLVTNTVAILVVLYGHGHWGIHAVAAGVLFGNVVQVGVLASALSISNFRYHWVLRPSDPKLREILRSFRYPSSGHVLGESAVILQNFLSSFLGSGSLTVMRYASRVVQAVGGILLGSVVQVTLPLMAKLAAANDLQAQRKTLLEGVRLITVVGVPVCVWLILSVEPLVILLFERGEFSRADAALTALLISFMVPDILLGRIVSLIQTLFYANMDQRIPLISTVIYTCAHTVFAIILVGLFGIVGLPIAVVLAALSNTTYMIVQLHRRFGPIEWNQIREFQLRVAATCVMGSMGFVIGMKFAIVTTSSYLATKVLHVAMPTAFGFLLFVSGAFLFRLIDSRSLLLVSRRAS
jgi:putative peptidoglycan lipid II flippase